jgi:NodT family efflux transporter outer membrane factor (OMF) lipoprotein
MRTTDYLTLQGDACARRLLPTLLLALLTGCALGPKDGVPEMPQPAQYGVEKMSAQVGPDGAQQRFVLGQRAVPQWWQAYRSPALSAWVDEALQKNYSLAQAEHNLAGAHEQLRAQIGESMYPSVDASLQSQRQRALGLPNLGNQTNLYNVFAGQISASYTFDLFGVARYANSALAAQVDAQSYQLDAARRALAANLVIAAVNSAALKEQVAITEQLVALAAADADELQRRQALGATARDDVQAAQASAASLRASLPGLRSQWQAARHALAVLMGRTPDNAPPDLALSDLQLPEQIPVAVPSELLQQRPDILAADAAVKVAAAQEAVAAAEMFPSLSINASFGQSGFTWPSAIGGSGAVWGIGASITQPLFHGGALRAKRRAAHDAYLAAQDNYRQTVLNAFQNVADSLGALTHDADTLTAAIEARSRNEQSWRDAQRRAALGALANGSVRAGEKQFQNARLSEVRATAARLADTATLFQAMGVAPAVPTTADSSKP